MKIKFSTALIANLDFTIEMAAKQMAFQEFMVTYCFDNDIDAANEALKQIHKRADDNIGLLRAKLLQYAEIAEDDLLNGRFEI